MNGRDRKPNALSLRRAWAVTVRLGPRHSWRPGIGL